MENHSFLSRLKAGLSSAFSANEIDDDFYEEIEEILIMSDVGVVTTEQIIDDLKSHVKSDHLKKPDQCRDYLIDSIRSLMQTDENLYEYEDKTSILMIVGVNGVGKTTSIGKLALNFKNMGKKVIVAAADTFRAAAVEQLEEWAVRAGVDIVKGVEGQDPSSVLYDAISAARARHADILLCDTAGRLHNKKNLMDELKKMNRVIEREWPEAYKETLVVLDGATGQNALNQAREFKAATDVKGVILTKLDGTAKGGIAIAVESELGIPVKYIGVGEKASDLKKFDADDFVNSIFEN